MENLSSKGSTMKTETLSSEEALEFGIEPEPIAAPVVIQVSPEPTPQRNFYKQPQRLPEPPRPLPANLDAEMCLLSSLMRQPHYIDELRDITPQHFHHPAYGTIYQVMQDMRDGGRPINQCMILIELQGRNLSEQVGGNPTLDAIEKKLPTGEEYRFYADTVIEKWQARQSIALMQGKISELFNDSHGSPNHILEDAIFSLQGLKTEKERPKSSLTIRTVGEIFDMEFDEADNFFGDRIIAAGQPVTFLGPGGVGKSRLMLQLAICMILGRPFLGIPTHARGKKWLFIQTENSNRRLKKDVVNMLSAMGCHNSHEDMKAVGNCLFFHTIETDQDTFLDLEDPVSFRQIELLIDGIKPDFSVFDPLNTFTSLDLNSDQAMKSTVTAISRVVKRGNPDRVPIVIHHSITGKAGAAKAVGWDKSSYGRNSKALYNWTRAQLNIVPADPDDSTRLVIAHGKNNNGAPFREMGVIFNEDRGIYLVDPDFDPQKFREEVGLTGGKKDQKVTNKDVAAIIDESLPVILDKGKLVAKLVESKGVSSATSYRVVAAAEKAGVIKFSSKTGGFFSPSKKSDEKA